ncbi:ECF transporter S component [Lactobacillus delbrueckii subsp. lactis]|uniref:ECF transporter S component n=1 Tax=Lactobacillus delbrueckii TaxID=1584 RepID=UPI001E37387B|nr:ECF transporter S component [Lactobacillus delbrueckii]MCD5577727.1 ECF transporter S component [Lactobacillus delbrueckii subsp. lactis]
MDSKEISSKNKASFWSFKLSAHAMTLIPAAVGINYVAKAFAEGLKLPVWLGSLGTFLASMLAGPVAGAISGFINNVIYGLTLSPVSTVYALTSIGIGLAVAWLNQRGFFKRPVTVLPAAILIALVSAVISTPLNVIFWSGQTGIAWGDALFASLVAKHVNIWIASFLDEFVLDLLDKTVVAYLAFLIYKLLPKRLVYFFKGTEK